MIALLIAGLIDGLLGITVSTAPLWLPGLANMFGIMLSTHIAFVGASVLGMLVVITCCGCLGYCDERLGDAEFLAGMFLLVMISIGAGLGSWLHAGGEVGILTSVVVFAVGFLAALFGSGVRAVQNSPPEKTAVI